MALSMAPTNVWAGCGSGPAREIEYTDPRTGKTKYIVVAGNRSPWELMGEINQAMQRSLDQGGKEAFVLVTNKGVYTEAEAKAAMSKDKQIGAWAAAQISAALRNDFSGGDATAGSPSDADKGE